MTIEELISYAKDQGFSIFEKENTYDLQFNKISDILIQFTLPKEEKSFGKGTSLTWDVTIKDLISGRRLFYDWAEEYDRIDSASKYEIMKSSYHQFIETVTSHKIRIHEYFLYSLFGRKFGKIREVQYLTDDGWKYLSL